MTKPDILIRLRESDGGYFMRQMFTEAADEIERLRDELTASHESHGNEVGALTERLSLAVHERDVARLRVWSSWLDERIPDTEIGNDLRKAAAEIERLRKELARKEAKDGQATDG